MTADPRYADTLVPLQAYCERHGYHWRWETRPVGEQWRATVQILDPTKTEHRDRVRVWIGSTGHAELSALASAIAWSIEETSKRLAIDGRSRIGGGNGNIAGGNAPTSADANDNDDRAAPERKPRI